MMRREDHLAAVVACNINDRMWTAEQCEHAAGPAGVGITLAGATTDHPAPPARAKLVAGSVLIERYNGIETTFGTARLEDWQ